MAKQDQNTFSIPRTGVVGAVDEGLRSYMLRVFNYMGAGVALSGGVAWLFSNSLIDVTISLFNSGLIWVFMIGLVIMPWIISARINKMSSGTAQMLFWVYASLMGMVLAPIFLAYTGSSIARTFFVCSGTFLGMSLYGYTTRRDLSGMGSFLFMGLIGLFIAMVVNIFMQSQAMDFVISIVGVLIFTGLTAYDVQRIKELYQESDDSETLGRKAVIGALNLYLDFINLFLFLLRFLGNNR